LAGIFGTILNTPFDVIKTRVQNSNNSKPNWVFKEFYSVLKNEGFFALYKGFVPKVLRLGPGGGILYLVYNKICSLLTN
jgi:solute carrier family 25 (mitochondrial 2-oxodicarboxylate transporter), member 21